MAVANQSDLVAVDLCQVSDHCVYLEPWKLQWLTTKLFIDLFEMI
jgi:hypothetical protein